MMKAVNGKRNPNHPMKGSQIKVEPITKLKNIELIKKLFAGKPRDLALFVLGINTNLRASDLCRITAGLVRDKKPMEDIELREKKTGKLRRISLNKVCVESIHNLLVSRAYRDDDPLFISQRGGKAITPIYINGLVKKWTREINLKGNYGAHSLRKTWGYHQRKRFNVGIPELMVCFNHSTQRQTLDYLCIQPEEIKSVYANEI